MLESLKIKKLIIKNFRKFENIEINFQSGYSAIVGENGEGKTTILEAIDFVLSPGFTASKISYDDFYNGTENPINIEIYFDGAFDISIQDGYNQKKIPCDGVFLEIKKRDAKTPNKAFSECFTVNHYCIPILSEEGTKKTSEGFSISRTSGSPFKFSEKSLALTYSTQTTLPKCFYFSKKRERNLYKGYNSSLDTIVNEFNWRFNKQLRENNDIESKYNESVKELEDIIRNSLDEKIVNNTINGVNDKLREHFGLDNLGLSFIDKSAPFNQLYLNYQNFDLEHSGSGITLIISFVLLDVLANLSKGNIFILVDEPELHLHPQLQKRLFNYICSSENQFIYTTHSNILISLKDWENIIRIYDSKCSNTGDISGVDRKNLEEMVDYYKYATIFLRENNDLFFSKKVIIVEGPVDKHCIQILIKRFGDGINIDDITIIYAQGKENIKYYALVCKAFGIQTMSIYDEDKNNNPTLEEDELIKNLSVKFYSFNTSLETILGTKDSKYKASDTINKVLGLDSCPDEFNEMIKEIRDFMQL